MYRFELDIGGRGRIAHSCTVRSGGGRAKELYMYDRGRRERGFSLAMCAPLSPPLPLSLPPLPLSLPSPSPSPLSSLSTLLQRMGLLSLVYGRGKARGYSMLYRGTSFLAVPLPPLLSVSSTGDNKKRQLDDGKEGEGVGQEPNRTTARKPGPL